MTGIKVVENRDFTTLEGLANVTSKFKVNRTQLHNQLVRYYLKGLPVFLGSDPDPTRIAGKLVSVNGLHLTTYFHDQNCGQLARNLMYHAAGLKYGVDLFGLVNPDNTITNLQIIRIYVTY